MLPGGWNTYMKRKLFYEIWYVPFQKPPVAVIRCPFLHFPFSLTSNLFAQKPENVGFDIHGRAKLFDFGFAREAHNVRSDEIAGR